MTLSIGEALKLSPLAHGQLVAGAEGLHRSICDVHVRSLPAYHEHEQVNYGELIVLPSTSFQDPIELEHCIHALDEQHAAALVIAGHGISEQLIEQCNVLQLPLILLNTEAPLDVLEHQLQQTIRSHTEKLTIIEKQRQLIKLAMQTKEAALFDQLAYILNMPIAVFSRKKELLFSTSNWSTAKLTAFIPAKPPADMYAKNEQGCFLIGLMNHHECLGYVLIIHERELLYPQEELLYFQAADIVTVHLARYLNPDFTKKSYLWTLALQQHLHKHLNYEGFMTTAVDELRSASFICLVTRSIPQAAMVQGQLQLLGHAIRQISERYQLVCTHIADDDRLTTIIMQRSNQVEQVNLSSFLEDAEQAIYELTNNQEHLLPMQVAISKPKQRLQQLQVAYEECLQALELCEQLKLSTPFVQFSDLEFNALLQHIPISIRTQFCSNLLQPLLDKDEHYRSEILKTLDAYLEHEASVTKTANALFVHRNTVLYRIDKVSELLGLDFKKLSHLMQLRLALVFYKLSSNPLQE